MSKSESSDYLSTVQTAKYLETHIGTLANWRYYGIGPRFIRKRRRIWYIFESVKEFKACMIR